MESQSCGFESWFCLSLAVGLWGGNLVSLCLHFLFCKMGPTVLVDSAAVLEIALR